MNYKCSLTYWQQMRLVSTTAEFADVATGFMRKHAAQILVITDTGFIREQKNVSRAGLFTVGTPLLHNFPGNTSQLCFFCQLVVELNQRINGSPKCHHVAKSGSHTTSCGFSGCGFQADIFHNRQKKWKGNEINWDYLFLDNVQNQESKAQGLRTLDCALAYAPLR